MRNDIGGDYKADHPIKPRETISITLKKPKSSQHKWTWSLQDDYGPEGA
ncbi:hypothetical protein [Marinobacter sp.]|nr:hypothetical protein [Marinobacter sp.]MBQ0834372.1 hypothetical protein [Marinobacter sp.]